MLSIEYEGVVYTPKIASDFAFGDVPLWSRLMIGDPDGSESGQCLSELGWYRRLYSLSQAF